jgi:hypothetical protein
MQKKKKKKTQNPFFFLPKFSKPQTFCTKKKPKPPLINLPIFIKVNQLFGEGHFDCSRVVSGVMDYKWINRVFIFVTP